MSQINPPWQPPPDGFLHAQLAAPQGPPVAIFRQGDLVVMHRYAALPDQCFYTGEQPASERMTLEVIYRPVWVWLTILAGPLILVIVSILVSKRATVAFPVHESVWAARRTWNWACIGIALVGTAMLAGGITMINLAPREPLCPILILGGIAVLFLVLLAYLCVGASCHHMDDYYIWLPGAHEKFLATLSPWPFAPQ